MTTPPKISVVTPTLGRPQEVRDLLHTLSQQKILPFELILVDAAPKGDEETANVIKTYASEMPYAINYIRRGGGTAIQRNFGIDLVQGDFIAFIDDDVRLQPDFFAQLYHHFAQDKEMRVGGIVGYRTNKFFAIDSMPRWQWYKRLNLLSVYEPGRYDYQTGYPINASMCPPFTGTREVDFMTTACAMWRTQVFAHNFRFDPFFVNYGVLEDAQMSLRAKRSWTLLQCGDAHCIELSSPRSRENQRLIGYKGVINYYYVFKTIAGPLTAKQKFRFWRYQLFELCRLSLSMIRRRKKSDVLHVWGRLEGITAVLLGKAY